MKIRNGFVSNSSTSSFICKVCGEIEADRDAGISDFEMFECVNGHVIHEECVTDGMEKDLIEKFKEEIEDNRYEVSAKFCPVCQLKVIQDEDIIKYLLKKVNITEDIIKKEIQEKYGNIKKLDKDLWVDKK